MKRFIEGQWKSLESQNAPLGQMRTIGTGVETAGRPVKLGIDASGERTLLLPIGLGSQVQADDRSGGIQVQIFEEGSGTTATRTAIVRCHDRTHWDAFDSLLATLLTEIAEGGEANPSATLAAWRAALAGKRMHLSREALMGLWGELYALSLLAEAGVRSLRCWTAQNSTQKDYSFRSSQLEVKATSSTSPRRVRVSGIEQLETAEGRDLYLLACFVESDPSGDNLHSLVEKVVARGIPRDELNAALHLRGATDDAVDESAPDRWTLKDEALWKVTSTFPKVVRSSFSDGIPRGVQRIQYEIDVDSIWPSRVDASALPSTLLTLTR